jgi:hypothetical protein
LKQRKKQRKFKGGPKRSAVPPLPPACYLAAHVFIFEQLRDTASLLRSGFLAGVHRLFYSGLTAASSNHHISSGDSL